MDRDVRTLICVLERETARVAALLEEMRGDGARIATLDLAGLHRSRARQEALLAELGALEARRVERSRALAAALGLPEGARVAEIARRIGSQGEALARAARELSQAAARLRRCGAALSGRLERARGDVRADVTRIARTGSAPIPAYGPAGRLLDEAPRARAVRGAV